MKTFIIIFSLFILSSAFGQNGGYVKAQKKSDIDLVKAFGKSLVAAPSSVKQAFGVDTRPSEKSMEEIIKKMRFKESKLEEIWSRQGGAREKLEQYLRSGDQKKFDNMIIYNAQKYLSSFLIEAVDTKKTPWIRDIARLYLLPLNYLTVSNKITFAYPYTKELNEPPREELTVGREFKLWVSEETSLKLYGQPFKKKDGSWFKSENLISSSQFLYAVSVIIHYAIENNLDQDFVFKDFIDKYYPIAMKDHYLRWILNRDISIGTFQTKGWGCNSGNFSHKEHVAFLMNKKLGTIEFPGTINVKKVKYCNMYQDRDGWIAVGLAHLLVAHQMRPDLLKLDPNDEHELKDYLQDSLNLFNARSEVEEIVTSEGNTVLGMVFDKGGNEDDTDLKYSGYLGNIYPGKNTFQKQNFIDKKTANKIITVQMQWDQLKKDLKEIFKERITVFDDDLMMSIKEISPPTPPKVSWDMSHSRRFVNYYWSFDKTIKDLNLAFSSTGVRRSLEESRNAYANNLFYKTVKLVEEKKGYVVSNVKFTNYLCGNNGWYRVNYNNKDGAGDAPFSLGKTALSGGQAYFIKFNNSLYLPIKSLYDDEKSKKKPFGGIVYDELNSTASLPLESF